MKQPLRILLAEDNPDDAELILRELRRAGYEPAWERVDSGAAFRARLRPDLDIILSDYEMPNFGGPEAFELVLQSGLEIPFIIISGTIGEDTAVAVMKLGANDYLMKDRLGRLGQAVAQALEQAQLRKARRKTEARYERLVYSNAQGVFFWKLDGTITVANDAFLGLLGYDREDLEAGLLNWSAMTPPEYASLDRQCLEEIAAKGVCTPYEKEYLRRDGTRAPVLLGAASFEDDPTEGVGFAVDLTERKKLDRHLLRAQRMESIGTLAGGIAHDLNNILAPIMMSVPILRRELTAEQREGIISTVEMSAARGAQIVRQVLTFGRGLEGEKRPLLLGALIEELVKIMRETFPKSITLTTAVAPEPWSVLGDATQLHQVLLNLCVNARDAMPEGGTLRLTTDQLDLDASYASMLPEATPGPYVLLSVSDTGSGIPPEIADQIFDPFFTTKAVGTGTGLGLSTALGIVKSHGGFIQMKTHPGQGTVFQLYLPASRDHGDAPEESAGQPIPQGHGELVLIVDDETTVREATRLVLETAGYHVQLAADGTEALALFAMSGGGVAAVLTDLMMPYMSGVALIQALQRMQPSLPIVASTGFGEKAQIAQVKALGIEMILQKPFGAETLLRALDGALHPAPAA